jgi:hypothetical protein
MAAFAMANLFSGLGQSSGQRQGTGTVMLQQVKSHARR